LLRADRSELIRNPEAYLYTVAVNLLREQRCSIAAGSARSMQPICPLSGAGRLSHA
jgi:hypothetical protein